MCGIIYTERRGEGKEEPATVNQKAMLLLQNQISRGKEGFGAAFIQKDGSFTLERSTEMCKLLFDNYLNPAVAIMIHHRHPTSSSNTISQTHPMLVSDPMFKFDYLVDHNGSIWNSDKLKKEHEDKGLKYKTEQKTGAYGRIEYNDSESLAIELAMYLEGITPHMSLRGSFAFIALKIDKKEQKVKEVIFAKQKNSNLHMNAREDHLTIASECRGNEVKEDLLYTMDFLSKKISRSKLQNVEPAIETVKSDEKIGFYQQDNTSVKVYTPGSDDDADPGKWDSFRGCKNKSVRTFNDKPPYEETGYKTMKEYYSELEDLDKKDAEANRARMQAEQVEEYIEEAFDEIYQEIGVAFTDLQVVLADPQEAFLVDLDSEVRNIQEELSSRLEAVRSEVCKMHIDNLNEPEENTEEKDKDEDAKEPEETTA